MSRAYKNKLSIRYYFIPRASLDLTIIKIVAYMFKAKLKKQIRTTKAKYIDLALFV